MERSTCRRIADAVREPLFQLRAVLKRLRIRGQFRSRDAASGSSVNEILVSRIDASALQDLALMATL